MGMVKNIRVTFRRQLSYNTKSNTRKVQKTPGGKLVYLYTKKAGAVPKCGDTKKKLRGIKAARPAKLANLSRTKKTVNRAYGGCLSAASVKERIVRVFLI